MPLSKTWGRVVVRGVQTLRRRLHPGDSNLPFDEWTEVGSERRDWGVAGPLTHHVHILEMNGPQLPSHQSQKRRTSKNLTTQHMVDPVGPSHAASLRVTQALHEATRVPPMDYRDNRQRWAESHQSGALLLRPVVYFYSGVDTFFNPNFT